MMLWKAKYMCNEAKGKFKNFLTKERGGTEIVATVLILAVVIILGGIFWDKIAVIFSDLWAKIDGAKSPMTPADAGGK